MVAGVAHEVRNPLCGITITLSALSHDFGNHAKVKPYLDAVATEVDRLNYLMEQLLEHSRPLRIDDISLNMRDLVNEAIGEFSAQARAKGVSVICKYSDSVQGLRLDRRKMHGVFTNLIENALQHVGSGGQVLIAIHPLSSTPVGDGHPRVQIQISDTGSGIAPENLNKIFEPFFTTRPDGIGLGLAIVQKTIHDHGGVITARSDPGKGATFIINLPLESNQHGSGQREDSNH
jgi:signal transduction histidine kinase